VVVLTGAGISAESGIPTFRGPEGYWTVGAREYHPMEMATARNFSQNPEAVWAWYLYRRSVCRGADPNAAHQALAKLERHFSDHLVLITQNVDGLHRRAGSRPEHSYEIHGNIDQMRCVGECTLTPRPIPEEISLERHKDDPVTSAEWDLLSCPDCGGPARPHVLWFDEYYDEPRFRFDSSLAAVGKADLLCVIGTTGSTNLPLQVGSIAAARGIRMIVINPEPSPFTEMAARTRGGRFVQGLASVEVPRFVQELLDTTA
jgi:NAD-dependent deacetylase